MKKILTIALAITFLLPSFTLAAPPSYSVQRTLIPETNSLYYLGTTSPSTRAWKALYADQICLTADICRTVLTGGGGSGGGSWSTTTSTVTGRFINYPNNTTDIPCIGGTATTTCKTWFDPNTNINQINGILKIGDSVAPQSTGFGTNGGKYQLHFSTSTNDVAGGDFYNIDPGIEAAVGLFFQNNKSPLGGIGLAQTYYGGVIFSGGGWNGAALGVGALPANSLGVYASDGALVLGSATSTGHIDFITGPSSFSSGAVDATLLNNGNWGIGTTSPYARLSLTNATLSTGPALAISTSTITATSTAFTIDSNGFVGIGTSTPASALSIGNDQGINFTRATSTFSGTQGGINIKTGCFAINGNCLRIDNIPGNVTLTTQVTGILPVANGGTGNTTFTGANVLVGNGTGSVGTAATTSVTCGGSTTCATFNVLGSSAKTITNAYDFPANNATSSQVIFSGGFTGTNGSTTNFIATTTLGVATGTPGTPLGVTGNGVFTGVVTALSFNSTSTTATSSFGAGVQATILRTTSTTASSTFANGISLTGGCFAINGACVTGGGATVDTGGFNFLYPFPNNATSTQLTFSGGLIATNASSTNFIATTTLGVATSTPGTALGVTGPGVFTGQVEALNFYATSTTATSTFLGKIDTNRLTAATMRVTGLVSCDTIDSDLYGNLVCGTDSTGAGGAVTGNGITGMMAAWSSGSNLVGTSTVLAERFVGTSTTAASSTIPSLGLTNLSVTGNAEIGVPRYPWLAGMLLSVDSTGLTEATGTPTAGFFNATSTTASSTFQGLEANLLHIRSTTASSTFENGINLTKGCFAINGACITGGGGGSGTLTGNGIAGMMSAWTSATNLIATSSLIGERIIATSTTATSTILGSLNLGVATSTAPQTTLYIGGSSYTETQVLSTSTSMSLDFCTTRNNALMGVGTANIAVTWVNSNLCPGKTVILSVFAPKAGLIGSTTFAGTAATGPVVWDGNVNPGSSVINGSVDRFLFTSTASSTVFISADLTGTF